jgi:hypothetical protein
VIGVFEAAKERIPRLIIDTTRVLLDIGNQPNL